MYGSQNHGTWMVFFILQRDGAVLLCGQTWKVHWFWFDSWDANKVTNKRVGWSPHLRMWCVMIGRNRGRSVNRLSSAHLWIGSDATKFPSVTNAPRGPNIWECLALNALVSFGLFKEKRLESSCDLWVETGPPYNPTPAMWIKLEGGGRETARTRGNLLRAKYRSKYLLHCITLNRSEWFQAFNMRPKCWMCKD